MRIIDFDDHVAHELARVSYTPQRLWLRRVSLGLALLGVLVLIGALISTQLWWLALPLLAAAALSAVGLGYYEWSYRKYGPLRGQLRAGLSGQRRLPQVLSGLDDSSAVCNAEMRTFVWTESRLGDQQHQDNDVAQSVD